MTLRKFILGMAIFAFCQPTMALSFDQFGLGYGILNSGILTESVSDTGETSIFGSFTFHFLTAQIRWKSESFRYGARIAYTVLPRKAADDAADITQLLFTPQFGYAFGSSGRWVWNNGLSLLYTQSKGKGGSVVLNNGNTTSTFFRPSNTVTSMVLNIESGVQFNFSPSWTVSGDLLINSLFGDKRNLSLFLGIGYYWGGEDSGYTSFGGSY